MTYRRPPTAAAAAWWSRSGSGARCCQRSTAGSYSRRAGPPPKPPATYTLPSSAATTISVRSSAIGAAVVHRPWAALDSTSNAVSNKPRATLAGRMRFIILQSSLSTSRRAISILDHRRRQCQPEGETTLRRRDAEAPRHLAARAAWRAMGDVPEYAMWRDKPAREEPISVSLSRHSQRRHPCGTEGSWPSLVGRIGPAPPSGAFSRSSPPAPRDVGVPGG